MPDSCRSRTLGDVLDASRRGEPPPPAIQRWLDRHEAALRPAMRRMQADWKRAKPIYNRLPEHLKRHYENVAVSDALKDHRFMRHAPRMSGEPSPRE